MERTRLLVVWCVLFLLLNQGLGWAQGEVRVKVPPSKVQRLDLVVGKSQVLDTRTPIRRASLANPDIADVVVLSPTEIYLTGKTVGVTTLTLWQKSGELFAMFDVVVAPDLLRLKEDIHRLLPHEQAVEITAMHDRITLAGTVSSTARQAKILEIAEAYAPENVVNLLQVAGVQQVMLEVRVLEMNRNLSRRLGINFNIVSNQTDFGVSALNSLTGLTGPSGLEDPITQVVGSAINAVIRLQTGGLTWTAFIDALKEEAVLKILAEPTLIAMNGQEAQFLSGGEFPYPVPQSFGNTTIEFKKFGVGLAFTPTVLNNNHISIAVTTEVSELDFTNSVAVGGLIVPAISTRRANTVVELADGQSFAIAGLLRDTVNTVVSKFPVLGDLPILGALFRSSEFQKNQSELVVIVTAHLVKPLNVANLRVPTDTYIEPNDWEFYLMGWTEGLGYESPTAALPAGETGTSAFSRLEGDFGHMVPHAMEWN